MQEFLSSIQGQLLAVAVIVALLVLIFKTTKKEKRNHVKAMTYSAIGIAIAFILNTFVVFKMPQAGSATLFSMLVIVLIGYWFGTSPALWPVWLSAYSICFMHLRRTPDSVFARLSSGFRHAGHFGVLRKMKTDCSGDIWQRYSADIFVMCCRNHFSRNMQRDQCRTVFTCL